MNRLIFLIFIGCFFSIKYRGQTELWGITNDGGHASTPGISGIGTIFKLDSMGNNYSVEYPMPSINAGGPRYANFIEGYDGMLYTAINASNRPVICQYNYTTQEIKIKNGSLNTANGAVQSGGLIIASNGLLYGITIDGGANNYGTIFSYDIVNDVYSKKIDFDHANMGSNPHGSLFQASNGLIYGMANAGGANGYGTLFQYNPSTNAFLKLVDFNTAIGANPYGSLIEKTGGLLYGMTSKGGALNHGVVFEFNINTNVYTKKKEFGPQDGGFPHGSLLLAPNGKMYGLTTGDYQTAMQGGGSIFEYDPSLNTLTTKFNQFNTVIGPNPFGSLSLASDGKLYGLLTNVINGNSGSFFQYDYVNNIFTVKHVFSGMYGGTPNGSVMECSNGKIYGLTMAGGISGAGTIFEYDFATDSVYKQIDFGAYRGGGLNGKPVYEDGKLFIVSGAGGSNDAGCIFKYDIGTKEYTKLKDFSYIDGAEPQYEMTKGADGKLYGTTSEDGQYNKGTIFQYDQINNIFTKKIDLAGGNSGEVPGGSLTLGLDGNFYGIMEMYGGGNAGALFKYDPVNNIYTKMSSFNSIVYDPVGKLLLASDGNFYGVTKSGGTGYYSGVLYRYNPVTNVITKIYDFAIPTGRVPTGTLVQASNGKLYGVTELGGANNNGVLFQYDLATNIYTKKIDFPTSLGFFKNSLMQASNGKLYIMHANSGSSNVGGMFEYDINTNTLIQKYNFSCQNSCSPFYNGIIEVPKPPDAGLLNVTGPLCKGTSYTYSYSTTGVFNPGNTFSIELSNAYGYFLNPVILGTVNAVSNGTVQITLPNGISDSNLYKIRIRGSNPSIIGDSIINNITISGPTLTLTPGAASICINSSQNISASGAITYTWVSGQTTSSINIAPTTSSVYTVTGADINNCSDTKTISVTVDLSCQDVWPGDANSDGVADNLDVLELGLHYTQTGPARAITGNSWQSYVANNWSGTITNGKNLNHSDCNGNGTIDDNDTLAIYNNYGLIHAFKSNQQAVINPQLSIVPDQPAVVKGTWGTASVYLGDAANTINNINGLAFTINFDNTLIETNNVWIEYPASFIEASNLHFRKLDFGSNNLYTATTHTVSNNVSGNGLIAKLYYQIKSSLTSDQLLNLGIVQANQSDASGNIIPLTSGTGTLMAMGSSVGVNELSTGNVVSISPSPASSNVSIISTTDLEKVEVINLNGQVLLSEQVNSKTHRLNVETLANGIYFVKAYIGSKQVVLKKLIIQD